MSKLLPMPSEKASYVPVQQRNSLENETLLEDESPTTCSGGASDKFELYIVCGLLIASNIVLVITLVLIGLKTKGTNISLHTGLDKSLTPRWRGYFAEEYNSANATKVDQLWEDINASHGVVKVDPQWAFDHGLPPTRAYKPDRSQAVYTVAAYHALHCLPYLHRILKEAISGTPLEDWEPEHAYHCLNVVRAELMCTADDTLLTSQLDPETHQALPIGFNQTRQCRDFGAIRDWATKNSACFLTVVDHPGQVHWGENCPSTDGIIIH